MKRFQNTSIFCCVTAVSLALAPTAPAALEAYWSFNEGAGTAAGDSSGNGNNGTFGTSSWTAGQSGAVGDFALNVTGGTQAVTVPTAGFGNIGTNNAVTLSLWLFGDAAQQPRGNTTIQGMNGGNRIVFTHTPWSNSVVYWDSGNAGCCGGDVRLETSPLPEANYEGSWSYWTFVKNGNTDFSAIYRNGTLLTSTNGSSADLAGLTSLLLAADYRGFMDDVAIYSQAISTNTITAMATGQLSGGITYADSLVGSNGYTKSGAGTATLSTVNKYRGVTTVSDGILRATAGTGALPGNVTVSNPGTLQLVGNNLNWANSISGNGTVNLEFGTGSGNTYLSGIGSFTGQVTLTRSGASTGDKWNTNGIISSGTSVVVGDGTQAFITGGNTTFGSISIVGTGNTENRGAIRLAANLTAPVTVMGNATIGAEGGSLIGTVSTGVAGTSTLTVGTNVPENNLPSNMFQGVISDGTGTLALSIYNFNSGNTFIQGSRLNTYSGGTTLLGNASGTRLRIDGISGTPYGSGPITVGQVATDKAGIFFTTNNQTLPNDIVTNTTLGTDLPGLRADATNITLSGKITANLAPATFSTNGTGSYNLTGQVTGPNGITLDNQYGSSIIVTLNNGAQNNNYSGNTTIAGNKGTLILGQANQIPDGAGRGDVVNNGTLRMNGFSETINGLHGTGTVDGFSGTPTITVGGNNASGFFSGTITDTAGTASLIKTGTGTQILTTSQTYAGSTTVSGGTLQLGASSALPVTGALYQIDASNPASLFQDAAGSTAVTTSGQFVGHWADAGGGANDFTQATATRQPTWQTSQINGLPGVVFDGINDPNNDRLAMTNSTSVTSVFIVNKPVGLVSLDGIWGRNGDDFGIRANGSTGWENPGNGADFSNPAGSAMYINGVAGNSFANNTPHILSVIRASATTLSGTGLGDYWGNPTYNRVYSGSMGEIIAYSSALGEADRLKIEAYLQKKWLGLSVAATNILPASTDLTVASGATLDAYDLNQSVASLTGPSGSSVKLTNSTLNVAGSSTSTFGGVISGNGNLTRSGSGTLVLTGNNSYTGATTVSAGTLAINGSLTGTSSVTVAPGARLQGTGTITTPGGVTVNGTIAPGNSIGTMTVSGPVAITGIDALAEFELVNNPMANGLDHTPSAVIMNASTTFANEALITGATRVAGVNDVLIVTGADQTLTFNTNSTLEVLMLPTGAPTGLLTGYAWDIIDANPLIIGGVDGFWGIDGDYTYHGGNGVRFGDIIMNLPDLWDGNPWGYYNWNFSLFQSHGIIVLVPEPSRALLVLLAASLGLLMRRRR